MEGYRIYTICNDEITLITSKFNAMKEMISRFKSWAIHDSYCTA